ncbi:hypothetical protein D7003_17985 [Arthrobacter oryzae]|uniref:Uncharacterized protein n=1 Tax=Arthrobacter oryzae TaxID=409290 RepID=A0A3N0BMS1_9MICC|nr:hypothetical protein D7003_17985 [Arthrobacter oryzae]
MSDESAVSRISAYVYGNVLVLAAIVASSPSGASSGEAAVYILGTALTTFLAHVLAHHFSAAAVHGKAARQEVREELRDAVPILTSGYLPAAVVGIGALIHLDGRISLAVAAALVLGRLLFSGLVIERLSGKPASAGAFWGGIGLAAAAGVVVAGKLLLAH